MKNKLKSVIRGNAEFLAGALTATAAFLLANLGCMVLVCMVVLAAFVAVKTIKSRRYSKAGKVVIIVVTTLIALSIGMWHRNNFHHVEVAPAPQAVVDTTPVEETTVEEEVTVVEEEETVVAPKRNRLNETTRKECIDIKVTNSNTENLTEGKTEVEGEKVTEVVNNNNNNVSEEDNKVIEDAKSDDSKEVTEMGDGITAVTDKVTEEEKVEEVVEVEDKKEATEKVEIPEEVEEITSEESKNEEEIVVEEKIEAEAEIEEDKTEEDFADMSDEELEVLFEETTETTIDVVETEVEVEDVIEEVEVEIETPNVDIEIENVETQEIEEDVVVEDIEDTTEEVEVEDVVIEDVVVEEKVEEVAVTAIDGYTTTVGSQIQFKVSGDDVVIEGLDGINYTFNNGVLTIDAGSEATVISVCVSNSVSSVDFNITVNGIIG